MSITDNNKLLLTMFVSGRYEEYIPFFLYFAQKAYPEYYSLIIYDGQLSRYIQRAIKPLDRAKYRIKEVDFKLKNESDIKFMRWLYIPSEYFKFENVYIGDVDIWLMREKPALLEKHLAICEREKLPFSNTCGIDDPETRGNRVTGLHFFRMYDYMKSMKSFINHYNYLFNHNNVEAFKNDVLSGKYDNQKALYVLLQHAFKTIPNHTDFYYHGFHIGHSRVPGRWKQLLENSPTKEADYQAYYEQLKPLMQTEIYRDMYDNAADFVQNEIDEMVKELEAKYE